MGSKLLQGCNCENSESRKPSMKFEDGRMITAYFSRHPKTFSRTAQISLGLSKSYIQRVLWNESHLFSNKLQVFQVLEEGYYEALIDFSNFCINSIKLDASIFYRVIFSDYYVFQVDKKIKQAQRRELEIKKYRETREVFWDS